MTIFVVTCRYTDGSGSGAVSAHWTEQAAAAMCVALNRHGDTNKTFAVHPVPCDSLP